MIEGAGHVLNLDEPDRFHAEVLALLEKEAVL
jgi:pimeloyl-ACP methyl ester carboxylesterase